MTANPPPHLTEEPAVARDAITAMLPADILRDDELVLILAKPSLWFIPLTSIRFILIVIGIAAIVVRTQVAERFAPQNIAILASVIVLGRLVWAMLVWTSHIYLLTNQRLVTIKGVINVAVFQCTLRKIQRTALYKPFFLRLFALGTIGIGTASANDFDTTWEMLPRPLATHEQIVAAIHRAQ
jgi:uncharacterized membrane protein YdbT with pleckstrin-like domain